MTLNGVMAVTLRYFTEFVKPVLQKKRSVAEFIQESIIFLVRVQCRCKDSSRSLSHLLMSFLFINVVVVVVVTAHLAREYDNNDDYDKADGDHHWHENHQ